MPSCTTVSGQRFAHLFADTRVHVNLTADFATAAWTKLALDATGAISAATLVPRPDLRDAATEALIRQVVGEAADVGSAEGACLGPDLADEVLAKLDASAATHPNSLHADRLAGRRMEIDVRNAAVVRLGARHSIPTPANSVLVDLLTTIESAQHAPR